MSDYVSRAKEADKVTVAVSADLGTGATKLIRTFMASALWEGNTLYLKDASGNNLMSTDLGTKFLPLTAGPNSPLTGDLYFNADNNDRAIHFNSSSTAHHWRIAYLGSGTGNANYLAFQNNGADGNLDADGNTVWINALKFELEELKAHFGSDILPTTDPDYTHNLGSSSARWGSIYGTTLDIGTAATNNHTIKGKITLTGEFIPGTTATYSLGDVDHYWKKLYVGNGTDASATDGAIIVNGGITAGKVSYFAEGVKIVGATDHNGVVNFANGTTYKVDNSGHATFNQLTAKGAINFDATATVRTVNPETTNTYTLGTSSLKWKNVYATTFNGNLSGTATKAKQDQDGRAIDTTYLASLTQAEHVLTAKNGDGTDKHVLYVAPTDSNGIIPLKHIPATAIERVIVVENQTARLALTTDLVQDGDVVKENDTGIMYFVCDDTKLTSEDGYQEFHAGMAAWAAEADYADEAGKATYDSNQNKIDESYIIYPFVLSEDKTKVTLKNGKGTEKQLDYNFYPTEWTWTNGTTAGPTATISMAGMEDISVAAIPSASASISGIVTTGAQTFAGKKSFKGDVLPSTNATYDLGSSSYKWQLLYVNKTAYIGNGDNATSASTGALQVDGGVAVSKNIYVGENLTVKGNTVLGDTSTDTVSITGNTTFTGNATHNGIVYFANGTTYQVDNSGHATFNNLTVKGNTSIGDAAADTISITGATTITGNTAITGHLTPGTNATYNLGSSTKKWQYLYINKTAYIGNGDDTSSTSTGAVQVDGGLSTSKNVYVGANLTVKGTTTLGDAETDTVSIAGDTTFSSDVVINKTLNVKGAVTLGDAESDAISIVGDTAFTNDVTIGKTLTVTGAVTTKGAVTLGDAEGDTVTVNGDTSFKNDVSITKTLTVEKQVRIGNGTDISSDPCDLEVAGGVDIGQNLRVTGGTVEFKQEARVVYDSTKKAFNFVFD